MFLRIEPASPVPIYRQLMEQIRFAVASGRLKPEEQLPSARDLGQQLQINLLTVVKAYAELVREGTLEMRRGLGTYVPQRPVRRALGPGREALQAQATALCRAAFASGMSIEALHKMIEKTWHEEMKS